MDWMNKAEIIDVIAKLARANDGVALGVRSFEKETGITPYQWGKYWARFTDAQREAGLEPNRVQSAIPDETLLALLAAHTRKLGRFPTYREQRLECTNNVAYPQPKTFLRLGSKDERVWKTFYFCDQHDAYQDVADLLHDDLPKRKFQNKNQKLTANKLGFVYLMLGHPGEYKIGRTNLVDRRLAEVGAKSSRELELVHYFECDDPAGIEAYWHNRFKNKRLRGEWFKMSKDDVRSFKRWRKL